MMDGSTKHLPFFANHAPGSVGERLLGLSYGLSQIVHLVINAQSYPPEKQAMMLNAMAEIAANLYFVLATMDATVPPSVLKRDAPQALPEKGDSEAARAEARVRVALRAYADYRAMGGLK